MRKLEVRRSSSSKSLVLVQNRLSGRDLQSKRAARKYVSGLRQKVLQIGSVQKIRKKGAQKKESGKTLFWGNIFCVFLVLDLFSSRSSGLQAGVSGKVLVYPGPKFVIEKLVPIRFMIVVRPLRGIVADHRPLRELVADHKMMHTLPTLRTTYICDPGGHGEESNPPNCPKVIRGECEIWFGPLVRKCRKSPFHWCERGLHRCEQGLHRCERLFLFRTSASEPQMTFSTLP